MLNLTFPSYFIIKYIHVQSITVMYLSMLSWRGGGEGAGYRAGI